jgi:MFS family permease
MAFQFQSFAALSPLIVENYALSFSDIGFLIGLYFAPGIVVAIPGGAISAWFGDKRVVTISLILMLCGGGLIALGSGWGALVAGRLLAGVGGVVLNVVMTKMVIDWFADHEISTAMAIFINSWPVGIALALLILPTIAAIGGLALAWATVLMLISVGLVLFVLLYHPAKNAPVAAVSLKFKKFPALALFLAGSIWALYNAALAMIFSFGPAVLNDRGLSLAAASSMTSIFMVVLSLAIPLGGYLADRTGRRDTIILVSLLSYVFLMPLILFLPVVTIPVILIAAGILFGLAAGPIVGLPSSVLPPESRAFAMGVYYALYYAWMMGAPALAGVVADQSGNLGLVIVFGAFMAAAGIVVLAFFRRFSSPTIIAE